MKRIDITKLLVSIGIPLAVGGLSALLSGNMDIYGTINTPAFVPPAIVFPIVWSVLYILLGISFYGVWTTGLTKATLAIYIFQLALNFMWSPIFFALRSFWISLVILAALWIAVLVMIISFTEINRKWGLLQIPYLLWLTLAAYLNVSIAVLN